MDEPPPTPPPWSKSEEKDDGTAAGGEPQEEDEKQERVGLSQQPWFQMTTLAVICFNALWIGVDVQANNPRLRKNGKLPLEPTSTVIENLFCLYFTLELAIRFREFTRKLDCLKDGWFVFDGLLVFFMVIETWIMAAITAIIGGNSKGVLAKFSALRLLRLLRLTRMARLMNYVPELMTLVKGMLNAAKAVSFILMFLILCMYVFAIVFTAQLGDPDAPEHKYAAPYWETDSDPTGIDLFGSLGDSMMTLFTRGVLCDNLAETLQAIKDRGGKMECVFETEDDSAGGNATANESRRLTADYTAEACTRTGGSLLLFWVFIVFTILSAFCLLNMLIGVLCEVIENSAAAESEATQMRELREHMRDAFHQIDTSKDGLITQSEFQEMKKNNSVRESLEGLGVEAKDMNECLDQMQESLFVEKVNDPDMETSGDEKDRDGFTFEEFMQQLVHIRPDTPASALDIEVLRIRVEREERDFNEKLDMIEEAISKNMLIDGTVLASSGLVSDTPTSPGALSPGSPPPPSLRAKASLSQAKPALLDSDRLVREAPTEVLFAVLESRGQPGPHPFSSCLGSSLTAPRPESA